MPGPAPRTQRVLWVFPADCALSETLVLRLSITELTAWTTREPLVNSESFRLAHTTVRGKKLEKGSEVLQCLSFSGEALVMSLIFTESKFVIPAVRRIGLTPLLSEIITIRPFRDVNKATSGECVQKTLPNGMRRLAHPWDRLEPVTTDRAIHVSLHFCAHSPEVTTHH